MSTNCTDSRTAVLSGPLSATETDPTPSVSPEAADENEGNSGYQPPARSDEEIAAMLSRTIRAYQRRLLSSPLLDTPALTVLAELQAELEAAADAVAVELARRGFSWAEIARETGMTRQGARKRWQR